MNYALENVIRRPLVQRLNEPKSKIIIRSVKMPQLLECPKCNSRLHQIIPVTSGDYYRWNEHSKKYEMNDSQIAMVFKCSTCQEEIGGWRDDGEEWGIIPEVD